MKKDQLSQDIEKRFVKEESKVVETTKEEKGSGKYIRVLISLVMSVVILGSLLYTLITSIK
ncbi:hypothetical protein ACYSNO_04315 [Enterococcus sp. LJL98]